jgi:hypothetical protein
MELACFFQVAARGYKLKKIGSLLFILLMACASDPNTSGNSSSASIDPSFLLSVPTGNGLVFLGVAGKRSSRKETLEYALEDAARRVSIFNGVTAEYIYADRNDSTLLGNNQWIHAALEYDREGAEQYIEILKFDPDKRSDILEIENAVIIRTLYPVSLSNPIFYVPTYNGKEKRPNWVDAPPASIGGYNVGVGYSGRYSSTAETWKKSFDEAIFSLVRSLDASSKSEESNIINTSSMFGYSRITEDFTYSLRALAEFYVLDAWMDPQTKAVWTLAIARKAQ